MTKFFATANANGLISVELNANTLSEAITELKTAIADRAAVDWIDDARTDLEDEVEVSCNDMGYSDALALCGEHGADFEWGSGCDDDWSIWSVTDNSATWKSVFGNLSTSDVIHAAEISGRTPQDHVMSAVVDSGIADRHEAFSDLCRELGIAVG